MYQFKLMENQNNSYNKTIDLKAITKSAHCVTPRDGEKVYEEIIEVLRANGNVCMSFKGIILITSNYLNASIGRLLEHYSETDVRRRVIMVQITEKHKALVDSVIRHAVQYYTAPKEERDYYSKFYQEL